MTDKQPDFGARLKELEDITEWFESEDVELDAALAKFERGMELADGLKKDLQQIENRVEVIKQRYDAPSRVAEEAAGTAADADDEPSLF